MATSAQTAHCITAAWSRGWHDGRAGQFCALVCCAAFIVLGAGSSRCPAQSAKVATTASTAANSGTPAPADAQQPNPPAANAALDPRGQQLARECADLLKLATDLKAQVDKSTKDQLSVTVVREASQIERLARKVKSGSSKD
jgi:hypothetical protein